MVRETVNCYFSRSNGDCTLIDGEKLSCVLADPRVAPGWKSCQFYCVDPSTRGFNFQWKILNFTEGVNRKVPNPEYLKKIMEQNTSWDRLFDSPKKDILPKTQHPNSGGEAPW